MRIAGGLKCASDPHVVCALRYGPKSERGSPSNPTPANCNPLPGGCAAMHSPRPIPPSRTEPGIVPTRTTAANRFGDPQKSLRFPERSSFGGAQGGAVAVGVRGGTAPASLRRGLTECGHAWRSTATARFIRPWLVRSGSSAESRKTTTARFRRPSPWPHWPNGSNATLRNSVISGRPESRRAAPCARRSSGALFFGRFATGMIALGMTSRERSASPGGRWDATARTSRRRHSTGPPPMILPSSHVGSRSGGPGSATNE